MKIRNVFFPVLLLLLVSCQPKEKFTTVLIHTDYGDMKAILYNDTPRHKKNFTELSKKGFYDNTVFHRVIQGFMIQGGDPYSRDSVDHPETWGMGGPPYLIPAEIMPNHVHKRGAIAAARINDALNPQKKSSGSQFYIVQGTKVNKAKLENTVQNIRLGADDKFSYSPEIVNEYLEKGGSPDLDMQYTVFGEVIEGLDVIDKIAAAETTERGTYDRPVKPVKMTVKVLEEAP